MTAVALPAGFLWGLAYPAWCEPCQRTHPWAAVYDAAHPDRPPVRVLGACGAMVPIPRAG